MLSRGKMTPLEKKAYEIIVKAGDKGVLQSDLWKLLGVDSREGSRIAIRLAKKGFIHREPVIKDGRKTFRLLAKIKAPPPVKVDDVIDVPCFTCMDYNKCNAGSFLNPATCRKLTEWILEEVERKKRL